MQDLITFRDRALLFRNPPLTLFAIPLIARFSELSVRLVIRWRGIPVPLSNSVKKWVYMPIFVRFKERGRVNWWTWSSYGRILNVWYANLQ